MKWKILYNIVITISKIAFGTNKIILYIMYTAHVKNPKNLDLNYN